MGKRGPKPTPTATLKLRGSRRAGSRKGEPMPEVKIPAAPAGLDKVAKAEWNRVACLLKKEGLITEMDRTALEGYCVHYSLWRKYRTALSRKKNIGTTEYRRIASCASDAYGNTMKAAACFGMSPADRSRVVADRGAAEEDPMEGFLKRGQRIA